MGEVILNELGVIARRAGHDTRCGPSGQTGPTSGLEPPTCSLRVRFEPLYLSKVAYLQGKMFAAYHRVTCNYAHVSGPVSVRWCPMECAVQLPSPERPSAPLGLLVAVHGTVYARMCEVGGTNFLRKRLL